MLQIVGFRLLQGMFGAALVPLAQSILLDIYTPEERGSAMAVFGVSIMVGPVLGPVIGGWLTENISWRWVFYINLGIGAVAFAGISAFVTETKRDTLAKLDWMGFGTLSLTIASLQIFLDRGEQLDWFSSGEIMIEALICACAFYLFMVHTFTAKKSFVNPRLFLDRNFAVGMVFIFVVGVTYLASMALMTPYLQTLMGYPIVTAGLVMGPRGIGTMVSMFTVGKLIGKVEVRWLLLIGLALTAWAMWDMTGWTTDVSQSRIVDDGLRARRGLGFPLRAAFGRDLLDASGRDARRRDGPLQPLAQHRLQRRDLGRDRAADREHPGQPRRHRGLCHGLQPHVPHPRGREDAEAPSRRMAARRSTP